MKWFKHHSNSHSNLKHQAVVAELGMKGYGFFWVCTELVAEQGDGFTIEANKRWRSALAYASRLSGEEIDFYLKFFADVNLIDAGALTRGDLHIPKLADYGDEYSGRRKDVPILSGVARDNVVLDKTRIDKKRIDKTLFAQLWEEYPKKVGKAPALKAFEKLSPDGALAATIISAVALSKETSQWADNDGRYVPHLATYLNQRRWEDEIPEKKSSVIKL